MDIKHQRDKIVLTPEDVERAITNYIVNFTNRLPVEGTLEVEERASIRTVEAPVCRRQYGVMMELQEEVKL